MTEAFAIDGAWWLFWIRRYKQIFNKYLRFFCFVCYYKNSYIAIRQYLFYLENE